MGNTTGLLDDPLPKPGASENNSKTNEQPPYSLLRLESCGEPIKCRLPPRRQAVSRFRTLANKKIKLRALHHPLLPQQRLHLPKTTPILHPMRIDDAVRQPLHIPQPPQEPAHAAYQTQRLRRSRKHIHVRRRKMGRIRLIRQQYQHLRTRLLQRRGQIAHQFLPIPIMRPIHNDVLHHSLTDARASPTPVIRPPPPQPSPQSSRPPPIR